MISNALFYTFSTIAQTLAGAIALLGAFVLYRLQSLRAQIDEDSESLSGVYGSAGLELATVEAVRALHREGKYYEVLEFNSRIPIPANLYQADTEKSRLRLGLQRQKSVLRTFLVALVLTIGLIIGSVCALAAAPAILNDPSMSIVILRVGIGWFVICVVVYGLLIRQALQ
jgi:hypothetical protein